MGHGQMIWQRDQATRLVSWGIRFFLTAALTASKTPGGYAPFALGCVAAAGPGGSGLAALAGAGVGAVLFLDFADALPFLATAVLIFTTSTALRGIRLEKKRWFPAAVGVGGVHPLLCIMAQGLVLRVSLPRLLPRRAQEDVGRILFPQAELISPEVDLDGIPQGRHLADVHLGALGDAHVHDPPLDGALPMELDDFHGLSDADIAQCFHVCFLPLCEF